jgi:hypothetical protein
MVLFNSLLVCIYISQMARESTRDAVYELTIPQPTEIQCASLSPSLEPTLTMFGTRLRLQFVDPGIRIPIRLSVLPEPRTGSASQGLSHLSAEWSDANSGVVIERSRCLAGKFLIVPSAQRGSTGKRFSLIVYSTVCPVSVTQKLTDA